MSKHPKVPVLPAHAILHIGGQSVSILHKSKFHYGGMYTCIFKIVDEGGIDYYLAYLEEDVAKLSRRELLRHLFDHSKSSTVIRLDSVKT